MTRFQFASAAAFLSSTALIATSAFAQTPAPQPGTGTAGTAAGQQATVADCDRLVTVLEQRRPANAGVTVEQVRTFRTANNAQACRDALVRIDPTLVQAQGATTQTGQAGQQPGQPTNVTVQQQAPSIQVEQASPQITVQQAQPNVTVRQPNPEILVRQPAPTVTVNIPQPEIIVRMPQPEVNVAQAQPQVDVRQAQPNVQVTQPTQPQVQVTPAQPQVVQQQVGGQPNVQVQQAEGQPQIRYERAEPQVTVNQTQGQPNVRIERAEGQPAQGAQTQQPATTAQVPAPPAPPATAPAPATTQTQTAATSTQPSATGTVAAGTGAARQFSSVSELENMNIYNARGNQLGEVEDVLIGPNNQTYLVVGFGGFLGLGERRVVLPLDRFQLQNDRLVLAGMTEDQLRTLPAYTTGAQGYRPAENDFRAEVSPYRQ
jgi:sporulation protein YlmC with PRC-barrel domain